jgi:hypothetical protein
MPADVSVLGFWSRKVKDGDFPPGTVVVNTTSSAKDFGRGLSPFFLGPVHLWDSWKAKNVENAWQFSKVYEEHLGENGAPTKEWFHWAAGGWDSQRAVRYPMGKGRRPTYSLWKKADGKFRKLSYVRARKVIYGPLYRRAVENTKAWKMLRERFLRTGHLVLLDFDAYDHKALGMTLSDVLNCEDRKMGHAFVLAMMLTDDPALEEFEEGE